MIEIKSVNKSYDSKLALDNCSVQINNGSIFALVGVNGSGKSTLLRLIAGVFKPESGCILINNVPSFDNEEIKKEVLFISDSPYSNINTNIESLITFYSSFYFVDRIRLGNYLDLFEVNESKSLNKFSKGMRRRVYLAFALTIAPRILLLDEAFDGLDPKGRKLFKKELLKVMEEKEMTVVIASQSLRELEDICDSYATLGKGHVLGSGAIGDGSQLYKRYLIAFNSEFDAKNFDAKYIVSTIGKGKIFNLIGKGNVNEVKAYLESLNPSVLEISELTFEEIFLYESEGK